jgi:hypothetical protein
MFNHTERSFEFRHSQTFYSNIFTAFWGFLCHDPLTLLQLFTYHLWFLAGSVMCQRCYCTSWHILWNKRKDLFWDPLLNSPKAQTLAFYLVKESFPFVETFPIYGPKAKILLEEVSTTEKLYFNYIITNGISICMY